MSPETIGRVVEDMRFTAAIDNDAVWLGYMNRLEAAMKTAPKRMFDYAEAHEAEDWDILEPLRHELGLDEGDEG